jgi:hypothetical protein
MGSQIRMDFLFIVAYWLEFLLVSVLLWHRNFPLAKVLAVIAGTCATLAAVADVRENLAILEVLSARAVQDNDPMVQAVRISALAKWTMLFVAMIPLAFAFIGREDRRAHHNTIVRFLLPLPGWLFLIAGCVGLLGTGLEAVLTSTTPTILSLSFLILALGLITLPLALFTSPFRLL